MPDNDIRQQIQDAARSYLGVRWRHQGRSKDTGIDCAGLVVKVAQELKLCDYDTQNYRRNAHNDAFVRHFSDNMKKKRNFARLPGDVVLFRDHVFSCHSAIVTMKNGVEHIIHAYASYKKVIEEPLSPAWESRLTHCFEFYGVGG